MQSSRSPLKTLGMMLVAALAVVGAGALVVIAGALGSDKEGGSQPVAAQPVSDRSGKKVSADSISALYQQVKGGVVFVQSTTAQGQATGSGFVLDTDGHIVTNEHVVDGTTELKVRIGEHGSLVPAQLVGADASKDLAVLKVDPSTTGALHPLALAPSSSVVVGQPVIAIGSPFGLEGTLTSGIVSALDRDIQSPNGQRISGVIQTDAAINPGNSGGPLIDTAGRVIGINAQIASQSGGSAGIGFAIPADTVRAALPELKSGALAQQQQTAPQTGDPSTQDGQPVDPGTQDPQQLTPEQLQQLQEQLQQQQADPYGDGQQPDPYGGEQPADPYGDQQQTDPYAEPSPVF